MIHSCSGSSLPSSSGSSQSSSPTSIGMKQTERKFSRILLDDFYSDQSILITGGTGFVGKVLIEKLLYEFPEINKIYLLMRAKNGQPLHSRLSEMFENNAIFERLRLSDRDFHKKIYPINGDINLPGLGINPIDLAELKRNVSIVFHSAATIRFDEPLKYALTVNTLGTKRIIELSKKFINFKSFVHISTAYCTVDRSNIEEKVIFEPIDPDKIFEMSDWIDDDTIDHIAPMLYRGRPCSYHYTKSLAEHLLAQEVINGFYSRRVITNKNYEDDCKDEDEDGDVKWRPFPAAIVRPSIITPSWRDPIPGWIDNYNGTTGFMVVLGKGVLRSMHVHKDYLCDLIPVDVVINTCILSAWYASTVYYSQQTFPKTLTIQSTESSTRNSDVFVVNCVSGPSNPITWDEIRRIATPLMFRYPSEEIFRVPFVRYHRSKYLNQLNVLLEHTVPAAIIDFVFKFFGLTPILNQVYEKVHRSTSALEFFTTNEWTFVSDNMQILSNELNRSYREHRCNSKCSKHHQRIQSARESIDERFSIDLRRLIWKDYFKHYVLGIRKYLLKEDPGTISKAHNQMMILYTVTMMTKIILTGTILYQIVNPRSMIRESLRMFIGAKHQSKLLRQSSQSTSSLPSLLSSQSLMMKNFLQEIRNRSPLAMFTVQ